MRKTPDSKPENICCPDWEAYKGRVYTNISDKDRKFVHEGKIREKVFSLRNPNNRSHTILVNNLNAGIQFRQYNFIFLI